MPSKHIDAAQWDKIEEIALELTRTKNRMIKEGDVLKLVIEAGLKGLTSEALSDHFEYQPRYNAFLHFEVGEASLSINLEKPELEDVIESIYPDIPFVLTVYGNTNSGKTTFINDVVASLKTKYNISVYDDADVHDNSDAGISGIVKAWQNYKAGNSSIIGLHASTSDAALKKVSQSFGGKNIAIEKPDEMKLSNAQAHKPMDSDQFAKSVSKLMRSTPLHKKV